MVKRIRSSADNGSRAGSSASPAERRNAHAPASGVSKALCRHLLAENRKGSYNGVHERTGSRPAVRRKWQRGTRVNSHILFIFPEEGKARKILVLNANNPLKSHDSEERTQGKTKKNKQRKATDLRKNKENLGESRKQEFQNSKPPADGRRASNKRAALQLRSLGAPPRSATAATGAFSPRPTPRPRPSTVRPDSAARARLP